MASITVSDLYFNDVKMPDPAIQGFTVTKEKVWSSNAGRSASAKFLGDIVAIKNKLQIKWPPLSPAEVALIDDIVSNADDPFVSVRYTDVTGRTFTKIFYFGTPTYTVYSWAPGMQLVEGIAVDAVEQ